MFVTKRLILTHLCFLSNAMKNNKKQKDRLGGVKRFWVLGAGRFGRIAVDRISRSIPGATITVIDENQLSGTDDRIVFIRKEAVHWLFKMLNEQAPVDMIVPAIPVHVVYEWLVLKSKDRYTHTPMEISTLLQSQLPHPMKGKTGQIYTSHADFICPDNCPEPENRCTVTGRPRPKDLFKLLGDIQFQGVLPIVVRSHQLLPGVGGIIPEDFMTAYRVATENTNRTLLIATACRCHGVVNAVRLKKKQVRLS